MLNAPFPAPLHRHDLLTMTCYRSRTVSTASVAVLSMLLCTSPVFGQGVTPMTSDIARSVATQTAAAEPTDAVEAPAPRLGAAMSLTDDEVLARVNGRVIPRAAIDTIVAEFPADAEVPAHDVLVKELIDMEILAQLAESEGLNHRPDIAARLILQYTQTLANEWIAEQFEQVSNDTEVLREHYDAFVDGLPADEYRGSHILVETRELAESLIDEIDAGADFLSLAGQHSLDTSAHLGWLDDNTGVPEVTEALAALEPGEVTSEPVGTDFGYHVLRLDEARRAPKPEFDAVKPTLVDLVVQERLRENLDTLRAEADVEIP